MAGIIFMAAMTTTIMTDSNHRDTEIPDLGVSVSLWLLFGRGNRTVRDRLARPSPARPTAPLAWSRGLDWPVQAGDTADGCSLRTWRTSLTGAGDPAMGDITRPHEHGRGCS